MTILASVMSASASTATDPYPKGHAGYDVSYPQCGATTPAGGFGIIGVNGGRPFSYNSCLATELSAAPTTTPPSLYINTAYSGAYRRQITHGCSTLSASVTGTSAQKQAWAIGCSEASTSMTYAAQKGAANIAMWWLDVEVGNSWSSSDLTLNQYAIDGAVVDLETSGRPVGAYSSAAMWATITGAKVFTPTNVAADWEASGGSCTAPFTVSPVWLLQSVTSGGDSDYAC
ncbi:hypothetical protein EPN29_01105 [bacterium]|nr:MAG: hypothetical protein EPN29_01105 [bacterium]